MKIEIKSGILLNEILYFSCLLILIFLPFQRFLVQEIKVDKLMWLDEIFVLFSLFLFFLFILYFGKIKKEAFKILLCLFLLFILGLISGIYNGNKVVVSILGSFDYIKNFLIIPFFGLITVSEKKAYRIYKILHWLALFFCLVGIIQFISFYLRSDISNYEVRFGIPRVPSLLGHPNMFGLYSLLFFILDFSLYQKIRWQNLLLAIGIVLSVSRMVWIAFLVCLIYLLLYNKNKISKVLITLIFVFMLFNILYSFYLKTVKELSVEDYYRGYTLKKSLEIWKEHPLLGVGPGMYGGIISVIFDSPIYKAYNFSEKWYNFGIKNFHSLDQFWGQTLAEIGLIGTAIFLYFLYLLFKMTRKFFLCTKNFFKKRMLIGFSSIPIVLFIYLFGSGLNLTSFLLTYSILYFMILSIKDQQL